MGHNETRDHVIVTPARGSARDAAIATVEGFMASGPDERILADLIEASHLISMLQIPHVVVEHARRAGIEDFRIYVADLQQRVLRLMVGREEDPRAVSGEPAELRIEGTLAGRAYQSLETVRGTTAEPGVEVLWMPLLDGAERLGVVRATVPRDAEAAHRLLPGLASVVALMIVSKRTFSDSYAQLVRTRSMTVSAEMQWRLMPPLNFANDRMVIGAALEPAYDLGGDAFDYGLAGDEVTLAIFDAMGHDTAAGLAATLAIAACRNSRMEGAGPVETGQAVDGVLSREFRSGTFVTGLIATLDTRTGRLSWASHGHPPPVMIRGGRWVTKLYCRPATPLGTGLGEPATLCQDQLQPGDRIILYTDGIVEARDPQKREFGLERFVDFIIRRSADGLPVPETLRRLVHSILDHHEGRLDDDATVLFMEWLGPGNRAT